MDLAPCGAFHAPYDTAGRLSADTVTSLGPASDPTRAVDGSVLQIATAYDDMGRVATVTSYADVAGTSPVNQVEYVYNGWGTVDSEYQEPNGLVGPISSTTSVYVQYDYDDGSYTDPKGATAASYLRLDLVWYPANPNGGGSNFVNYLYSLDPSDGTIDNMMSRVDDIETTGVNDLMFRYLGAGTIATEDLSDLDIELDYSAPSSTSTAANFGTWDRFGRVRDQLWASYGSEWSAFGPANADPDHFTYTYDREGNVTSEASPQNTNFSQTYTYDALNRLTSSTRGDGLANQTWGLDGVGNMATVTMTSSTPQSRTVNAANEIAASSGIVTPLYDAAGNTIYGPSALQGQQATPVHCVYDAWNRLVAVYTDNRSGGLGAEIAGYQYDGLNRRVKKSLFDSSGNPTGGDQYYYNQNGQVIEDDSVDTNGVAQSIDQYVWGPGSAGAPLVCLHDGNANGSVTDGYPTDWRRYYLTDANGNVTTMIRFGTDPFGYDDIQDVTRVIYTAYGTATEMGENWLGAGDEYALDGPLYCGYWHDTETGLSQTQNRYYNPNLSTWINRDPIGYQGGNNLYGYVGDDPTTRTDPSGLGGIAAPAGIQQRFWAAHINLVGQHDTPEKAQTAGEGYIAANNLTGWKVWVDYKYTSFFSSAGYYTATVFKPVSESERQWILFGLNMEMTTLVSPISVGPSSGLLSKLAARLSGAAKSGRGFVSGRQVIIEKVVAARSGNAAAAAEIQAARALRAHGLNVHFRVAAGDVSAQGLPTSDFLVGGFRGGLGGTPFEVYSPITANTNRVVGELAKKLPQADRFVLDLSRTPLTQADLSNALSRINRTPGISRAAQQIIFVQNGKVIGTLP